MARAAHVKPATWSRYDAAQRSFNEFWAELEPALPAREPPYDEADVGLWLGDLVAREVVSAATMLAGLNKHHVNAGGRPLREAPAIQQALDGWLRIKPRPQPKKPFTLGMLRTVHGRIDTTTLLGARNFAMLVVGRAGAFRGPSELLAAELPLRVVQHGAEVDVHTKTDKHVRATTVRRIPAAGPPGLSPLHALHHYLHMSGHTTGRVFRNVSGGGAHAVSNSRPVSRDTLSKVVKHWAGELGCAEAEFASHSLRHGCADDLNNAEVPPVLARAVTGHASQSAYAGYGGREAARRARAAAKRREREALAQGSVERLRIEEAAWTVAVPTTRFPRSGTLRDCGVLGRTRSRANRTRGPEPAGKPQAERQECLFWPAAQLEAGTAVPGGRCARLTLAAKISIAKFGGDIQNVEVRL